MNPVTQYAQEQPVTLAGAVTAAITATVNLLALVFGWDGAIVAGVNLCLAAWIVVISFVVRAKVTPTRNVALTVPEARALSELTPKELDMLNDPDLP